MQFFNDFSGFSNTFYKFAHIESMNHKIIEFIRLQLSDLSKRILNLKQQIAKAPRGNLRVSSHKGKTTFYACQDPSNRNGTYLNSSQEAEIRGLAQKKFDILLQKELESEASTLTQWLETTKTFKTPQQLLEELSPPIRALVTIQDSNSTVSPDQRARKWQEQSYPKFQKEINTGLFSLKGEEMRSKSEVLLADRFREFGIPYRYEQVLTHPRRNLVPDFIVYDKRTGKCYIWEHFGMLDNEYYLADQMDKLGRYADLGYVIGKNLIVTFEGRNTPLNIGLIDKMIRELFLK